MTVLPIVYGLPDPRLMEGHNRGEVLLGGCCIEPGQPHHECTACGWNDGRATFLEDVLGDFDGVDGGKES